jgi:hypothetical protein
VRQVWHDQPPEAKQRPASADTSQTGALLHCRRRQTDPAAPVKGSDSSRMDGWAASDLESLESYSPHGSGQAS